MDCLAVIRHCDLTDELDMAQALIQFSRIPLGFRSFRARTLISQGVQKGSTYVVCWRLGAYYVFFAASPFKQNSLVRAKVLSESHLYRNLYNCAVDEYATLHSTPLVT